MKILFIDRLLKKINIHDQKRQATIYLVLAVTILVIYWQVNQFDFVYIDDEVYVTENSHIQSGISLENIRWAFSTKYSGLWNPLVWISLMLDYQIYGLKAGGYHLTNLLLHIMSTFLIFWLFNRMTAEIWKSAFVAAIFALHPLHVESVAWVAERKDVLSAFFWTLTLCLYVYYTKKPAVRRYLLVLSSFALATMSKPMVVTLPVIMILLDYWPLGRLDFQKGKQNKVLKRLMEKVPFFILSAVLVIITLYYPNEHEGSSLDALSLGSRLANAPVAFTVYLEKTFWPQNMAFFYPFPDQVSACKVLGASLFIAVVSVTAFLLVKRQPFLFVGWLWYAVIIFPAIGIIQINNQAMTDRYHYLPSIGIFIMMAWGIPFLIQSKNIRKNFLSPVAITFLAIMAILAWKQCSYWKNTLEVSRHALQVTKNNSVAHKCLADALLADEKMEEAIYHYNEAIRIYPYFIKAYLNKVSAYCKLGLYQNALEDLNKVILVTPNYAIAWSHRGNVYYILGQHQRAVEDLSKAISINPNDYLFYFNRGNSYIHLHQYQAAIEDFNQTISLDPTYVDAYNNRGFIYLKFGQYQKAFEDFNTVIVLKPDYAKAYNNRAFVYFSMGNIEAGCKDARKACNMGVCDTLEAVKAKGYCL